MVEQNPPEPRMLQQDGTTTDNQCTTTGDYISCPAAANFTFAGQIYQLSASLSCPLDATAQSDFRQASQEGLCGCDAALADVNSTSGVTPLDCTCFICPDQPDLFGVAFECTTPISGPCTKFNCRGVCNGDLNFMDAETNAPTAAPADSATNGGSAAMNASPSLATAALLAFTLVRMFR
jgi:hypothetical protein